MKAIAAAHAAATPGARVVHVRSAAGEKWVDPSMAEWAESARPVGGWGWLASPPLLLASARTQPRAC
jgi:hypothetical protein